jgi:hypothetical protein
MANLVRQFRFWHGFMRAMNGAIALFNRDSDTDKRDCRNGGALDFHLLMTNCSLVVSAVD